MSLQPTRLHGEKKDASDQLQIRLVKNFREK